MATNTPNVDPVYARLGEFVVTFQWLEDTFRQIGWFILDPARKVWPPNELRKEKAEVLADKVAGLFADAIHKCGIADPEKHRADFQSLVDRFHAIRRRRNKYLHSAYVELKAGNELQALLRSNPKFDVDPETGETLLDQAILSPESFAQDMAEMASVGLALGHHYKQLMARLR